MREATEKKEEVFAFVRKCSATPALAERVCKLIEPFFRLGDDNKCVFDPVNPEDVVRVIGETLETTVVGIETLSIRAPLFPQPWMDRAMRDRLTDALGEFLFGNNREEQFEELKKERTFQNWMERIANWYGVERDLKAMREAYPMFAEMEDAIPEVMQENIPRLPIDEGFPSPRADMAQALLFAATIDEEQTIVKLERMARLLTCIMPIREFVDRPGVWFCIVG